MMSRALFGRLGFAAVLASLALMVSPLGVMFITGREDLTFRVTLLSSCLATFFLLLAGAAIAVGRGRRLFFYLLALTLPAVLLAGLETMAIALHLANRIAPFEDNTVFANEGRWPAHLMSNARFVMSDAVKLYRPWQGDGITINGLGLRTEMPQPKQPGEWRIAVTGGSTVWGYHVIDADAIPAQLAQTLHDRGYGKVMVYNFGIEGAELGSELALLRRFRETYAIDQVLFYTGGNDVLWLYLAEQPSRNATAGFVSLELVKAWSRLVLRLHPSAANKIDPEILARMRQSSSLGKSIVAADEYCRINGLKCDFALQPWLFTRAHPMGSEGALMRTIDGLNPGLIELWNDIYASTLAVGPVGHTYDLRDALDDVGTPIFADVLHMNETGNKAIAQRLGLIAARAIP